MGEALRAPLAVTALIVAHENGITSLEMFSEQEWISAGGVVSLLRLSADRWVSGSDAGELLLWWGDQPVRTLRPAGPPGRGGPIWSLAVSPDGRRWASGDGLGFLQRCNADGQPLGKPILSDHGQVFALLLRQDGSLVSGGSDGSIRFWGAEGEPLARLRTRADASVWGLVQLANGEILSAGRYGTLQRWSQVGVVGKPL